MKTRNGFVSNSSSSSFIIAGKKNGKFYVEVDLKDLSEQVITSIDQLDTYFLEEYRITNNDTIKNVLSEDDYVKEKYDKAKKAIENGKVIYVGCVSSEDWDNPISGFLYERGFAGIKSDDKIEVIKGDE